MAYCEDTDLYQAFGAENISRWADLDNDADQDSIDSRINWAIDIAYEYVNSKLVRGHYAVPFITPPLIIVHLNALYAGILLYDARLISDTDKDQVSRQRKTFNNWIRQILRGQLKLVDSNDAPIEVQSNQYPEIDDSDDTSDEALDVDFEISGD